jgi:hypothetical protein
MDSDEARSYEPLTEADLARLGRVADAEIEAFFARNPHLTAWGDRVRVVALAQGAADHYLRGRRGVWDLDVIVCFAAHPALPRLFRRMVVSWDWGPLKAWPLPLRPARVHGPRRRHRLLGHPRPARSDRCSARVARRPRREAPRPGAQARSRTRAGRLDPARARIGCLGSPERAAAASEDERAPEAARACSALGGSPPRRLAHNFSERRACESLRRLPRRRPHW